MSKAVDRFNYAMNNAPGDSPQAILEQIKNQCTYLVEEVLEVKEGASKSDWENVLKEVADVNFVAAYLRTLVEAVGCNYSKAYQKVCDNNSLKMTTSYELAQKWLAEQEDDCYIATAYFEGVEYYSVRRKSDGKGRKFKNFPEVDLKKYVPKDLLND